MPQEKDKRMHGMTAFQSVAAKNESPLFHLLRREASLRGGL